MTGHGLISGFEQKKISFPFWKLQFHDEFIEQFYSVYVENLLKF